MSITTIFQEIAKQEEAIFKKVDNKYKGDKGAVVFSSVYSLVTYHSDVKIELTNELGHQNIGTIYCELEQQPTNCAFMLDTRNNFFQFFDRTSNPLLLKCENPQFKKLIEQNTAYEVLKQRAKQDRFEPEMVGKNENGKYIISCHYYLGFNNKEFVIAPLLNFFKALITFLKNKRMRYRSIESDH